MAKAQLIQILFMKRLKNYDSPQTLMEYQFFRFQKLNYFALKDFSKALVR